MQVLSEHPELMLAWTIYISFLGALRCCCSCRRGLARGARILALLTAVAGFVVTSDGICSNSSRANW